MSDIDPVEFGRVIGHLEAIQSELQDIKARTMWRLDNLETRIEKIEATAPSVKRWGRWVDIAIMALTVAGASVIGFHFDR